MDLVELTPSEFPAFFETVVDQYADDSVAGDRTTAEQARDFSRVEIGKLLSRGFETPDHFFFHVRQPEAGDVGHVWFGGSPEKPGAAHLYYIIIKAEHRGKGYGGQAMAKLEEVLRERGFREIGLHVYTFNKPALGLYEKSGFVPSDYYMRKSLET